MMRYSPSLLLAAAGGALALGQRECIVENKDSLAQLNDCGSADAIALCLGRIDDVSAAGLEACYTSAGCSASEAGFAAGRVIGHCEDDGAEEARMGDLRLRHPNVVGRDAPPAQTAAPVPAALRRRDATSGAACFTSSEVQTSDCPVQTVDGRATTGDCTSSTAIQSDCLPGYTCSLDGQGTSVCMELENDLGVEGIVIAIIFAVAIVAGIGYLTFLSIRDRKEQRRINAKVEAVAVARAQTKKLRAEQQTSGVLRKHREAAAAAEAAKAGGDPFADRT